MFKPICDLRCHVTNLPITAKEDWKNVPTGEQYLISLKLLGDRILVIEPEGEISTIDIERYFQVRNAVVKEAFKGKEYVELLDLSNIHGRPTITHQRDYIHHLKIDDGQCILIAGYGVPKPILSLLNLGAKIGVAGKQVRIFENYNSAAVSSVDFIGKWMIMKKLSFSDMLINKKWKYSSITNDKHFEARTIDNHILFTKIIGELDEAVADAGLGIIESLFEEGYFRQPTYTQIRDFTETKGLDPIARKEYIDGIEMIESKYNISSDANYICGASGPIRSALSFVKRPLGSRMLFVNDVAEAFNMINLDLVDDRSGQKDRVVEVQKAEIDMLVEDIGSILWATDTARYDYKGGSPHLAQLHEAIELVHEDYTKMAEERNKKARQLKKAVKRLKRSDERTKEINQELHQINEQLIAEQKMKDQFMVVTSHELRSPLAAMIGILELIKDDLYNDEKELKNLISITHRNSVDLLRITDDLLDMQRIEAGRLKMEIEPVFVDELLHDLDHLFRLKMEEEGFEFIIKFPEKEVKVEGDRQRLKQVLTNLIGNAYKFTDEGSITVEVEVIDAEVHFRVIDTGIGIEPDKLNELFEPFSRLKDRSSKQVKGTGLGLSICRNLIEMMGGRIWIESEGIDKGSTMTFTLNKV